MNWIKSFLGFSPSAFSKQDRYQSHRKFHAYGELYRPSPDCVEMRTCM